MIRELARNLAALTQLADCVIIALKFRRGKFSAGAKILKTHAAMTLVRVRSAEAELLVKLIRPRTEIRATVGCRIQSSENVWRIFTASEILAFAEATGDEKIFYRLNPPIVPALLILETLCAQFAVNVFKLKFKKFITADESLSLHVDGGRLEIKSAGVRKISGEFS